MTTPNHAPLIKRLLLLIALMFGFAFALVPLYDLFCQATGLNGKTAARPADQPARQIDGRREIRVEFLAHTAPPMAWQFEPGMTSLLVHPGETRLIHYLAYNPTSEAMTGQAVPSVSPGPAAAYFKKMACFCFEQQTLKGGEHKEMALQFYVDPALPPEINTITLSYTLFDISTAQVKKP